MIRILKTVPAYITAAVFLLNITAYADDRISAEDIGDALAVGDHNKVVEYVRKDESGIVDEVIDAELYIDESVPQLYKPDIRDFLGVQYETNRGYTHIIDSDGNLTQQYKDAAHKLFKQPIVRWGGTSSNYYNVMDVIGPVSQRKRSILQSDIGYEQYDPTADYSSSVNPADLNYGPGEFIKAQLENNPDVRFLFCLSIHYAHPEDSANFIHFLRDKKDESEWGALRASYYGIEEPVNVYGIELGNEMYFRKTPSEALEKSATQWYIDTFKKHAEAINAVDPDIICIPCVNGNSDRGGFYEWNRPIVRELGEKYNVMGFHFYYSGYEFAYNGHWLDDMMQVCVDELGEDHGIKLAFTEHARWGTVNYVTRGGMTSALATAQFLSILMQRPETVMATYHCGTTTGLNKWYLYSKNGDDTIVFSSIAHLYKLYNEYLGDRILPVTLTSDNEITDPSSSARKFTVLATPRGSRELVLFLCNREPYKELNLNIHSDSNYTLKKEVVYTAPNIYSFEYNAETQDIFSITETEKNEKNFKSYHMPGKSIVCLVLESDGVIPGSGSDGDSDEEVTFEGEAHFEDIDGHWARSEIELLAGEGIVKGEEEKIFAPQQNISYAEFAAMLVRAADIETNVEESVFENITPADWYFGAVNSLAIRGYIRRGEQPEPDGGIQLKAAVKMIYNVCGADISKNSADISMYEWSAGLTEYEKNAFGYCIGEGIANRLFEASDSSPERFITRGEAASLIYRLKRKIADG